MDGILAVDVSAYTIPTESPESDGTLEWDSTTLVLVRIRAGGSEGLGYTYAHAATAYYIHKALVPLLIGKDPFDIPARRNDMVTQIRNQGEAAIAMMGVSAVDIALWDWKARALHLPLCKLLGQARSGMPLYGSGGFTSMSDGDLARQLSGWVLGGLAAVKMKVGRGNDNHRVQLAREAIGPHTALYVDANGAFNAKQALHYARLWEQQGVEWFEEPVPSDYLDDLRLIRSQTPMKIAAGEYGYRASYFQTIAGSVDVLQADATRCGGISGFLEAGHLCAGRGLLFSAHCAPSVHLHAALSLGEFYYAEYFADHVRVEKMLFDGSAGVSNGALMPDLSRPGLGLSFKEKDAAAYKVL